MENRFKKDKKQISIFITAGFPTIESTIPQIEQLQSLGVDFIELGIPFSDPMADGPTIQETSNIAIQNGMNLALLFNILEQNQAKIHIPLVLMGYFNPIFHFGLEKFLERCVSLNIKQVIIPDISLEVYEHHYQVLFEKHGVTLCFLVTPNSDLTRVKKMAEHANKGFIYLVTQNAITGDCKKVEASIAKSYELIKNTCGETPMMLGFGINNREKLQLALQEADGAIIGSEYLKRLAQNEEIDFIDYMLS